MHNSSKTSDDKCDIWSLGITLITLADQQHPYGKSILDLDEAGKVIEESESPALNEFGRWTNEFRQFINACTKKEPKDRPTARECLQMPWVKRVEGSSYSPQWVKLMKTRVQIRKRKLVREQRAGRDLNAEVEELVGKAVMLRSVDDK